MVGGSLCGLIEVSHRSVAYGFKPWLGYIRRLFHASLHLIIFRGCSAHLAYHVQKSDHETATFKFFDCIFMFV